MGNVRSSEAGEEVVFSGRGVAPGIAIGQAYIYSRSRIHVEEERIGEQDVTAELARLRRALDRSTRDLDKISSITRQKLGDDSARIFEAQMMMVADASLVGEVRQLVERDLYKADYAVRTVMDEHRRRIEASTSEFMRDRSHDIADVEERIVMHLRRAKFMSAVDPRKVVVAENLTAADVLLFSRQEILGCVLDFGGATSHVSIIARSLGLPAVVGTHGVSDVATDDDTIIADGFRGLVILNPTADTLARYLLMQSRYKRLVRDQHELLALPAETIDGRRIIIRANLEFEEELVQLRQYGAEGIGLFRTEMLFLMRGRVDIDEDDQFETYRRATEAVGDAVATIRLLDLGGDKMLPMAHREHNPFLGWRGIRVLLDKPDILEAHIRAILRASAFGRLRILVPMVTTLREVREVKRIISEQKEVLHAEGHAFDPNVPLGVMIEVPSAALTVEQYAKEVDFLSIGTNDLTQYVLAVDRGNDLVSDLFQELHPSILRLIKHIADVGREYGLPVSVCGEMASDTRVVPLLVGLGIAELSVSPVYIPHVKRVVRAVEHAELAALADLALQANDEAEVNAHLDAWLATHPFDLLHFIEAEPGHVVGAQPTPGQ